MERKELIEKVIAKLSGDPELLKTVGELTLDKEDFAPAKGQLPDTMYVLTGKVRVKADGDGELYHYHPIIEDCFLNPEATENKMVCSESLVKLQEMKKQYDMMSPAELVILAVSKENYKKLQNQLDEMIADLLGSIRRTSEKIIAENEARAPKGSLDFEKLYRVIMSHLMMSTRTYIGSALGEDSSVMEWIDDVEYDFPEYHNDCRDCDECDSDCCDDCEDCDGKDEEDDPPEYYHGTFFGSFGKRQLVLNALSGPCITKKERMNYEVRI